MICRHLESASSPSIFPDDAIRVEIENDRYPDDGVNNVTFPPLLDLRHLAIRRCGVTKIARLAFVSLGALQVLRLSDNLISDLALGSFEGLNYVREIVLDGNRLFHLPEGLFRGLDLDLLDLSNNLFAQIPGDSFTDSSVRSLNLNLNSLTFVEESVFDSLRTSLRELTLSYNRSPLRLHPASISRLNLSRLYITHSQINDTSFLINSTLLEVDISGNVPSTSSVFWSTLRMLNTEILYAKNLSLDSLPVDSLTSLNSLKVLDLSENRLSIARPEVFWTTTQLRSLNLAYNSIGRLGRDFSSYLRNLESLNLSGNALRHLYDESLTEMTRLKILDLRGNRLQFVSESVFRLASVATRIERNPLHCNCQLLWYRSWLQEENATSTAAAVTCASPFTGPLVSSSDGQLRCSPPVIDPLPEVMNVIEGEDLTLSCSANSDPLASISWTKDQDSILMSVTPSVTQGRSVTRMSAVLRMRRMGQGNAGAYVCNATTTVGDASATVTVKVIRRVATSASVKSFTEHQSVLLTTKEEFVSAKAEDTTPTNDSTAPVFETTELPATSPVEEPFTMHLQFSGSPTKETTEILTDLRSSNRLVSPTSSFVVDDLLVQANVSDSSNGTFNNRRFTTKDDSTTPNEIWTSSTGNDLRNDSSDDRDEAKLFPVKFRGIGIAEGIPVVGVLVAFVGCVILCGIGISWWFKKRRRRRQYKVSPSVRRSDVVDLRSYGNDVTQSIDSVECADA